MKRKIKIQRIILFIFMYSFLSIANSSAEGVAAEKVRYPHRGEFFEAPASLQKHFLWEIKSETNTVYLLGSIHMAKKDLYPLDDIIEEAFDKSDIVVMEALEMDANFFEDHPDLQRAIMYSGNETLKDNVSTRTYKLLLSTISNYPSPVIDGLLRCKAWYVADFIQIVKLKKSGYSSKYGLEKHFSEKAGRRKILELETIRSQIKLCDGLSQKVQELILQSAVKNLHKLPSRTDEIIKYWKEGDYKKLEEAVISPSDDRDANSIYEKLLYERNMDMAHQIAGYLHGKMTYFVIVGAAHLIGGKSILELLKKKGYVCKQL